MTAKIRAREAVRAAKARRDESRIQREQLVLRATESYYLATENAIVSRTAVETAEDDRASAVGKLTELGEPIDAVADLCGVTTREVRAALKRFRSTKAEGEAEAEVHHDSRP